MRTFLRGFLSPAVADRVAAGLEPVAVADRRAALGAASELLQQRFLVTTEALAAALVSDAGQDVDSTAVTLGVDSTVVIAAVDAETLAPGQPPPMVMPVRSAAAPSAPPSSTPPPDAIDVAGGRVPVDGVGSRRRHPIAIAFGVAAGLALVAALVVATNDRDSADDPVAAPPTPDVAATAPEESAPPSPGSASPTVEATAATPTATTTDQPTDDPATAEPTVLTELRFVTDVDVTTGEAGPAQTTVTPDTDVLAWVALAPEPPAPTVVEMTFEAPDGSRTVRPALVAAGISVVAVRLPEELGRSPGRYVVIAELRGADADPLRAELRIEAG